MSSIDIVCRQCGESSENKRLERCGICASHFCHECGHRALGGRKFCSPECSRAYYFYGEPDDDDDTLRSDG